jgi:hypothetical protein
LLRPAVSVRNGIRRNAEQQHDERHTAPLEACEVRQGVMEHFGGQILRLVPILDTTNDERVNPLKVRFVQFREAVRISLRGLDQQALLIHQLYKRAIDGKSLGRK